MREYSVTILKHDGSTVERKLYAKDRDDAMAFAKNIFRHHCKKITKCSLTKEATAEVTYGGPRGRGMSAATLT